MKATAFSDAVSEAGRAGAQPSRNRDSALCMSASAGRVALLVLTVIILASAAVACTQQQVMEMNLGTGLNQMRAANGLGPLTIDASLSMVARERAEDMAQNNYFSHVPPDGCDVRCLYNKDGITAAWVGEVIAWNTYPVDQTVAATLTMWRGSPAHFSVITNQCFTRMGTGIAIAKDGKIYQVAVFEGRAEGC